MKTALLLVDIQNDYFPGGRNELRHPEQAAERAAEALRLFRERGAPVVHVRHISLQKGATFFLPDTPGSEIHATVRPMTGEAVVTKHAPDSFLDTELQGILAALGVGRLVVCGMMSHMCIDTTVRSAKAKGYETVLLHDACATMDLSWNGEKIPADVVHAVFMASLQGTFARVVDSANLKGIPGDDHV